MSYQKTSSVVRVKSANNVNNLWFNNLYGVARRVGVCARICMVDSQGFDPVGLWNEKFLYDRNYHDANNFTTTPTYGHPFTITPNQIKKYYSEYDRFYPHFVIQQELINANGLVNNSLSRMMYFFRNNFTEIIQINTTIGIRLEAGYDLANLFNSVDCNITVATSHYRIEQGPDSKFTHLLKTLCDENINGRNVANGEDALARLIIDPPVVPLCQSFNNFKIS